MAKTTRSANRPGVDRPLPKMVERTAFQAELDALRVREKTHTREGDAIAASRRRLPGVAVDPNTRLIGADGPVTLLDAFEGRRLLIAYYFMWNTGRPASEQCPGCTWCTSQVGELSYLHSRDITFAVFCQGPYDQSARYREFMDWHMPWYSAEESLDTLLEGRQIGVMHLVCYVRDGDRASHFRTLIHEGSRTAAALTGGFQWALFVCGLAALTAVPVAFLLMRRAEGVTAAASSDSLEVATADSVDKRSDQDRVTRADGTAVGRVDQLVDR